MLPGIFSVRERSVDKENRNEEQIVEAAQAYVRELFRADSGGHGADHTMRVFRNAVTIAKEEGPCDMLTVQLAALLHDADDPKLFSTENNANARGFLAEQGLSPEAIDEICTVINEVSFSKNRDKKPDTLEGQIVQDADRLDAIGAVGVARTFAFGGQHGRPMDESIQHFRDKLLLLKDMMNTETAKREAEKRHTFLLEFLKRYSEETGTSFGS